MPAVTYGTPPGGGFRVDVPGMGGAGYGGAGFGFGGDPNLSWLGDFARKQARNKLAMQGLERKAAERAMYTREMGASAPSAPSPLAPYGPLSGFAERQRMQNFRNMFDRDRSAGQRYASAMGGPQSAAYGDTMRQMAGMKASGFEPFDYTGMTELARAGAGASAAAVGEAGANLRQGRGDGIADALARREQITRQYPGMAARMFPPPPKG